MSSAEFNVRYTEELARHWAPTTKCLASWLSTAPTGSRRTEIRDNSAVNQYMP